MVDVKNFPQQGVAIQPDPGYSPTANEISFNSDKSTVSGKLIITVLPPTHGRGEPVTPEPEDEG